LFFISTLFFVKPHFAWCCPLKLGSKPPKKNKQMALAAEQDGHGETVNVSSDTLLLLRVSLFWNYFGNVFLLLFVSFSCYDFSTFFLQKKCILISLKKWKIHFYNFLFFQHLIFFKYFFNYFFHFFKISIFLNKYINTFLRK
jgi:hypothetical protein